MSKLRLISDCLFYLGALLTACLIYGDVSSASFLYFCILVLVALSGEFEERRLTYQILGLKNKVKMRDDRIKRFEYVGNPDMASHVKFNDIVLNALFELSIGASTERLYYAFVSNDTINKIGVMKYGNLDSVSYREHEVADLLNNCRYIYNCNKIIIAHNHPSGSAKPSSDDIAAAKLWLDRCNKMDIELVGDYVIGSKSVFNCLEY